MPVTQNVHDIFLFAEAIEDEIRPRNQFAHAGAFGISRPQQREIFKDGHAVNQGIADAHGGFGIFFGNKFDRCLQVRDGLRRENYLAEVPLASK